MATGFYLLDHPQARPQYGIPRRGGTAPSGTFVIHTAENAPDLDGPDLGAENVAAWILRRTDPGSYHDLCDSDSIVRMAPWWAETWHETTVNRWAIGISAAVRAADWLQIPEARRRAIVRNMADAAATHARALDQERGIVVPARRLTRAEAIARLPGFIGHGEIDTARRTDPGRDFDWSLFLASYAAAMTPTPPPTPPVTTRPEEDDMKDALHALYWHHLGRPGSAQEIAPRLRRVMLADDPQAQFRAEDDAIYRSPEATRRRQASAAAATSTPTGAPA